MANSASDEQLIQWYNKGNTEAFETLYRRHKNAIYHYFYRQVQSASIADELHQDVWLNIIKSSSRFGQQSSFKTWLYRIAHNRLVDHYRQNGKQPLQLTQEDTSNHKQEIKDESNITAPDNNLQQEQINSAVIEGIEQLPREQKEVFLLHERSELTLEEIASITNSSYESTKSRLRYAVKKLRQHLAQALEIKL